MNFTKKIGIHILLVILFLNGNVTTAIAQELTSFGEKITEEKVSIYSGALLHKQTYLDNEKGLQRAVNIMEVNLEDPYTKVHLRIPNPINQLVTTTRQANLRSVEGQIVRGAINGSFVHDRMPMNLVTDNNKIINYKNFGPTSITQDSPVFQPVAFGMDKAGKPLIDFYKKEIQISTTNVSLPVYTLNNQRYDNQVVMFTPNHLQSQTGTNQWGTEIIVTNVTKDPKSFSFGDTMTGTITKITRFGETANSVIPENGFIISAHGSALSEQLKNVNVGEQLTVTATIDTKWQDASFIVGSGPMLVKNGAVSISMNTNSVFALERAPRTAVATTKDNRLLFITLDGRQSGYSDGATIRGFAEYLVNIGVDNAMNLDGGGTTTMVMRPNVEGVIRLANRPSDTSGERGVSTSLQVIDTTPAKVVTAPALDVDSLDDISNWIVSNIRAVSTISQSSMYEPIRMGQSSIKLSYDLTHGDAGTAAAYLKTKFPRAIDGRPIKLGAWVHGDGNGHWLRGSIIDLKGKQYTIDFTNQGGLNWRGWRYVTANIPAEVTYPISFEQVYIVQPTLAMQGKGILYFDQIEAIYQSSYQVDRFKDVPKDYWARGEIEGLNNLHIISGFSDGSFKPKSNISREHAAIMLVRALGIKKKATYNQAFTDVPPSHYSYSDIMAAAEIGLLYGKGENKFEPNANLTRAEMATIIQRAYNLKGESNLSFKDVSTSHWAYRTIQLVAANGITFGYDDQTFRPSNPTTRAEFSVFLHRAIHKK